MAGESNTRRGNTVYPVDVETQRPTMVREVKHFKKWVSWLIPAFVVANTVMFVITMSVNDCPSNSDSCIARFLGRFSFQPFRENPLLGPSSTTSASNSNGFVFFIFIFLLARV